MATTNPDRWIDPKTGYCPQTKTYHSLRPHVPLPPISQPLSITHYTFSLLRSVSTTTPSTTFLIDAVTGQRLSYGDFIRKTNSLASALRTGYSLAKGDVAFILCPASLHVPVIYFSLLSLGVVVSPANPISSESEVAHQLKLTKPVIAFVTSNTRRKIGSGVGTVITVDSPEFVSLTTETRRVELDSTDLVVDQSDPAAVLYSSGTTGRVKGVMLSHRNLIALIAGFFYIKTLPNSNEPEPEPFPVSLITIPLFHVFGFFMLFRGVALGETLVMMERFDFETMLKAVEKYKILYMPVSPPLIVALSNSELTKKYDLSSLLLLGSGGAPLGKEVAEKFKRKFPNVEVTQGYGLTETGGAAARIVGPDEKERYGSVGRLSELMEAKIVDPETGEALPPGHRGELWLRGPTVMQGYVGDKKATAETFDSEGWLKTGDLCYFDPDGFLYIVDRLKELIKYKGYQVPPAELEQLLHSHPEIADAAVIPYPDEEAGEIPMAFVVRKPGSKITESQVMEFIAKQVAPYKKIRRVAFINSIPKSSAGKILRRELVDHARKGNLSKL